jgi:hypothetical protein
MMNFFYFKVHLAKHPSIALRRFKRVVYPSVFLILALFPPVTSGQEEIRMAPMVVTATRLEEPVSGVPASATVITEEEIDRKRAITVEEAFLVGILRLGESDRGQCGTRRSCSERPERPLRI